MRIKWLTVSIHLQLDKNRVTSFILHNDQQPMKSFRRAKCWHQGIQFLFERSIPAMQMKFVDFRWHKFEATEFIKIA